MILLIFGNNIVVAHFEKTGFDEDKYIHTTNIFWTYELSKSD